MKPNFLMRFFGTSAIDCGSATLTYHSLRSSEAFPILAFDSIAYSAPQKLAPFPVPLVMPNVIDVLKGLDIGSLVSDFEAGKFPHFNYHDNPAFRNLNDAGGGLNKGAMSTVCSFAEKGMRMAIDESFKFVGGVEKSKELLVIVIDFISAFGGTGIPCFTKTQEITADYNEFKIENWRFVLIPSSGDGDLTYKHFANAYASIKHLCAVDSGCFAQLPLHKEGYGKEIYSLPGYTFLLTNVGPGFIPPEQFHAHIGKLAEVILDSLLEACRRLFIDLSQNSSNKNEPTTNLIGGSIITDGSPFHNQYIENRIIASSIIKALKPHEESQKIASQFLGALGLLEDKAHGDISRKFTIEKGTDLIQTIVKPLEDTEISWCNAKSCFHRIEGVANQTVNEIVPLFQKRTHKKSEELKKQGVDAIEECYSTLTKLYTPGEVASIALASRHIFEENFKYVTDTIASISASKKKLEEQLKLLHQKLSRRVTPCALRCYKEKLVEYVTAMLMEVALESSREIITTLMSANEEARKKIEKAINKLTNILKNVEQNINRLESTDFEKLALSVCVTTNSALRQRWELFKDKEAKATESVIPGIKEKVHSYYKFYDQRFLEELETYLKERVNSFMDRERCKVEGNVWKMLMEFPNSDELLTDLIRKSGLLMVFDPNKGEGKSAVVVAISQGPANPFASKIQAILRHEGVPGEIRFIDYPYTDEGVIIRFEFGRLLSTLIPIRKAREHYYRLDNKQRIRTCELTPLDALLPDPFDVLTSESKKRFFIYGLMSGVAQINNDKLSYISHERTSISEDINTFLASPLPYREALNFVSGYIPLIIKNGFSVVFNRINELELKIPAQFKEELTEAREEIKEIAQLYHQQVQ